MAAAILGVGMTVGDGEDKVTDVEGPAPHGLPPDLLRAVSEPDSGGIVIIAGAGCSFEPPTNLPLARQCAESAYQRLLADNVLAPGDCLDPSDLSRVADAVKAKTGSQLDLVRRLPRRDFRLATPNPGHMIAAALLCERVISYVLTLNYDRAFEAALERLDATEVSVVEGPEHYQDLSMLSLVYLHRSVSSPEESWILCTDDLSDAWRGGWEEAITRRIVSTPVNVFVGLGSPAAVLTESVRLLRQAVPNGINVFHVDPGRLEDSQFLAALDLPPEAYVRRGWIDFMRALASRVLLEQRRRLQTACTNLTAENDWEDADVGRSLESFHSLGLVGVGQVRARLLLSGEQYTSEARTLLRLVADLVLAVGLIERETGAEGTWFPDGVVEFHLDSVPVGSAVFASGGGTVRWLALEARLADQARFRARRAVDPKVVVVSGVVGLPLAEAALPQSISTSAAEDDPPVSA